MKKKLKKSSDVTGMMVQIQEQLATMDQKLDSFMTKSLTELAQALAASKPAPIRPLAPAPAHSNVSPRPSDRQGRPMFSVICFECGNDCEVPFKPNGNRPIYCRECFAKRKAGHGSNARVHQRYLTPESEPAPADGRAKISRKKVVDRKKPAAKKRSTAKRKPASKRRSAVKKKRTVSKKRK